MLKLIEIGSEWLLTKSAIRENICYSMGNGIIQIIRALSNFKLQRTQSEHNVKSSESQLVVSALCSIVFNHVID